MKLQYLLLLAAVGLLVPSGCRRVALAEPSAQLEPKMVAAAHACVRRADGRVWIEGVPGAKADGNGFACGLESVLAHEGIPVSYERVMGLSGLAFILQVDAEHRWEGTVDAGWWPLDPWGLQLRADFLGRAVGCEFREVGWITFPVEKFVALRERLPAFYAEQVGPQVRQAIEAGHPVLVTDDFGILVTGYDDAADVPPVWGRCARATNGAVDRLREWPVGALVVGRKLSPLDPAVADAAALRYAVALARDEAGPVAPEWRSRRFTGQKAIAAWAALLRNTGEKVEDRHHANVRQNLRWNRTAAVGFLREMAARRGGPAAEELLAAVACYEKTLQVAEAMAVQGVSKDSAARLRLAEQVEALAAPERDAAQHLEQAVVLLTVRRESDRVRIDGIKGFDAGQYASSIHGCEAVVAEFLGSSLSYDDLVGYDGFVFRSGLHKEMCPSAGHPCCGYMCIGRSARMLPWRTQVFEAAPWSKPKEDRAAFEAEACAAIKASIDRGFPVEYGGEEDGLIVGYADEGRRWLCLHPYYKQGRELFWYDEVKGFAGGQWPWGIVVWSGWVPPDQRLAPQEALAASLKQAVDMWRTEKREDYWCGDVAYQEWLAWLRGVEAGTVANAKGGMQGNGWCYNVLLDNRAIAGRWLAQQAEPFAGEVRTQLLVAADHYRQMADELIAGYGCPWSLTLGPGQFDQWTSQLRQEEIRRLESAREHDRAAIAAIEKALATLAP